MFERLSDIEIKLIAVAVLLTPIIGMMVWGHYKTSASTTHAAHYDFFVRNGIEALRAKKAEEYKARYGN
ncbi:MAG TPA: hypothetical protein VLA12_18150 [Planctomycetaceae bacterium]|nr:hypothetical protein [Planctomycetaceae bacterium]